MGFVDYGSSYIFRNWLPTTITVSSSYTVTDNCTQTYFISELDSHNGQYASTTCTYTAPTTPMPNHINITTQPYSVNYPHVSVTYIDDIEADELAKKIAKRTGRDFDELRDRITITKNHKLEATWH